MRVTFQDELPIPEGNLVLYRRIYVLEQWLRRIVMAGLMSKYGSHWRNAIPTEIAKDLKSRRQQLRARTYLDVESSDNVIWLLTLEELRRLMTSDFLWHSVKDLTGLQKADTDARVEELRQIRNVVGHNRATTAHTLRIFTGIEEYLEGGVNRFKNQTLYSDGSDWFIDTGSEDELSRAVAELWSGKQRQVFLKNSDKFYSVVSLPVPPFTLVSVPDLLEAFHSIRHVVLALYVNGDANEFSVVWPRSSSPEEHSAIVEALRLFSHYTETRYDEQDPKAICDPRIWFYFDVLGSTGSDVS